MNKNTQKTVYVIDDDSAIRDSLGVLIRSLKLNLTVELFSTAGQFIDFISNSELSKFSLLIIDYRLPGTSGFDLMELLSEKGIREPTVIMTGHTDEFLEEKAKELGAIEFFSKPFDPNQLVETILKVFDLTNEDIIK